MVKDGARERAALLSSSALGDDDLRGTEALRVRLVTDGRAPCLAHVERVFGLWLLLTEEPGVVRAPRRLCHLAQVGYRRLVGRSSSSRRRRGVEGEEEEEEHDDEVRAHYELLS